MFELMVIETDARRYVVEIIGIEREMGIVEGREKKKG